MDERGDYKRKRVTLSIAHQHSCAEVVVFREATRTEDEELRRYGDPSSNEVLALRRAAAKFGLGRCLYQK